MREEYSTCHCKSQRLKIDLGTFDRDERTRFVDNVLELLIESRFGPGCIYEPLELIYFELPPNEVDFDLLPAGFGPFSDFVINASTGQPTVGAKKNDIRSWQNAGPFVHPHSPLTLARGSPFHRRTYIVP